jgi:hypothetical protein
MKTFSNPGVQYLHVNGMEALRSVDGIFTLDEQRHAGLITFIEEQIEHDPNSGWVAGVPEPEPEPEVVEEPPAQTVRDVGHAAPKPKAAPAAKETPKQVAAKKVTTPAKAKK